FFHSEAEIPGGLDDVMAAVEDYIRDLAGTVVERYGDAVGMVAGSIDHLTGLAKLKTIPRLTFDEAAAHLAGDPAAIRQHDGWRSLTRHGERRLLDEVSPVLWVTHYDHLTVPFYQAYADDGRRTALNADLLLGIGEVVGCGERHATGAQTRAALEHHQVPEADYRWYVQMKDHFPLRTAGFGLGVERWLMWVLNQTDIREMQLAPRLNGVVIAP